MDDADHLIWHPQVPLKHRYEKKGRTDRANWLINGFREAVGDAGLFDLFMHGYQFTWFKSLGTNRAVEEKLDRALANDSWSQNFPNARLECLTATSSDHYPLWLVCEPIQPTSYAPRHFKFEMAWMEDPEFANFVRNRWCTYNANDITLKLDACAADLSHWSKDHFHNLRKQIDTYHKKLEQTRGHVDETNINYFNALKKRLNVLLSQEDRFWKQRAKTFWYKDGDLNTKFFHAAASTRKKVNRIEVLTDNNNVECRSQEGMVAIAREYFLNLFQKQNSARDEVLNAITPSITVEDNNQLSAPFMFEEFREAIFSMEADKCPGPDGFNPGFYQQFWDICGQEVFSAGCSWLNSGVFPPSLNSTNIALIPKGDVQTTMKDWRSIALCNVLYKVVAKVLANRLKSVLNKCISDDQSAFVPGRSILDNAMAAIELVHYMKAKTRGKQGDVALKLDIIDYSVILNGNTAGPIIPGRGLRQGDPLSPYLFIICAEGLSALIRKAECKGDIHKVKICRNAPIISHLLFADDCFLFFRASDSEAVIMKNILSTYEAASGQAINLQKSEIYCSRNVSSAIQNSVSNILGVQQVLGTGKYLGLPSMVGRSRKATFRFIKDRIWKKINSWSSRCLSQAGREIMIKSVLQSIPSYIMSIFLIPSSLCDEIEKMMNSFWWGHNKEQSKGIHWLSWERLAMHKNAGGLGFKSIQAFNYAMLGKQAWKLQANPGNLITRLFKAKYFPRSDFLSSSIGHNPSYVWRSIWSAKFIVRGGYKWSIGTGYDIPVWDNRWVSDGSVFTRPLQLDPMLSYLNENNLHIFFLCNNAKEIWKSVGWWNTLQTHLQHNNIADIIFSVLRVFNSDQVSLFMVLLWSIWQQRNDKVWRDKVEPFQHVRARAINLLTDWKGAQNHKNLHSQQRQHNTAICWSKPPTGRYKCNIDASFPKQQNKVGRGMCIRDDQGRFVLAKTEWLSPITDVDIGEALGILSALNLVHDLQLENVDFELDSRNVVTRFHSKHPNTSELGDIIKDCVRVYNTYFRNSRIEFIRRQANEVAHALARVATSLASFHLFIDVPICIGNIVNNEML
ncbi:unnamed protein product [Trifolium pratense]|uniref:Uncharacterized protein n=1 Tax=Trifolium pratense TaxID=57577 RepID=A0ACB0IWB7_TRIPR|nr:unnamed protein product [Trifolium pratense]